MVAPTSGRLCPRQRDRDERFVVPDLPELVGKGDRTEDRRCKTLPTGGAVLFRADLRRLYARMRLEFDRIGAGDADVYRVALIPKMGRISQKNLHFNDVYGILYNNRG